MPANIPFSASFVSSCSFSSLSSRCSQSCRNSAEQQETANDIKQERPRMPVHVPSVVGSLTDPLACASSLYALARPRCKHAAPASGSGVSVCHRLRICDLSRLSVFRPCFIRGFSSNHRGPNLRTSSRLGVFALSAPAAAVQVETISTQSCRGARTQRGSHIPNGTHSHTLRKVAASFPISED